MLQCWHKTARAAGLGSGLICGGRNFAGDIVPYSSENRQQKFAVADLLKIKCATASHSQPNCTKLLRK